MNKVIRERAASLMIAVCSLSTVFTATSASAEPVTRYQRAMIYPAAGPGAADMIADGLVIRPAAIGLTVAGTGLFIATLPFSVLTGDVGPAARRLIADPAETAFSRCFGCVRQRPWFYGR